MLTALFCVVAFAMGAAVGGAVMYVLVYQGVLHQGPQEKK